MTKSNDRVRFGDITVFPARPGSNQAHLSGYVAFTEEQRDQLIEELTNLEFALDEKLNVEVGKLSIGLWKRFSTLDGTFNRMVGGLEPSLTQAERSAYRNGKQQAPAVAPSDGELPF